MPRPVRSNGRLMKGKYWLVRLGPDVWEYEHRIVMERKLGRALRHNEHVRHRNGDPQDNRPENLALWIRPRPNPWRDCACGCGLRIRTRGKDGRLRRFLPGHNSILMTPQHLDRARAERWRRHRERNAEQKAS